MESLSVVSVRAAFHGIRIQSAVDKYFDRGAVNVNIGTQLHAGRVLGRVETAVQGIGVHVVADHALAEKVESGIRGMREFDRCLNAETVGIIKLFQVAVGLIRRKRFPGTKRLTQRFDLLYGNVDKADAVFGGTQSQFSGEHHHSVERHTGVGDSSPAYLDASAVACRNIGKGLGCIDTSGGIAVFSGFGSKYFAVERA